MNKFKIIFLLVFMNLVFYGQDDKIQNLKESIELASADDKPHMLNKLSKLCLKKNRDESLKYAKEAILLSEANGDVGEEMAGYVNKSRALSKLGKHKESITAISKVIDTDREFGNEPSLAFNLKILGNEQMALKDYSKARKTLKESFSLFKKLGDKKALGYIAGDLGSLEKSTGNKKEAINWYEKAVSFYEEIKNKRGELQAGIAIASINANRGDFKKSLSQFNTLKTKAKKYGLSSFERSIDKSIEIVSENKEKKEANLTEVDKEENERLAEEMDDLKDFKVQSLDEISKLSEANQILALRERLEKEKYDKEIKEKEEARLKAEQDKVLAETQAKVSKAEKEKQEVENNLLEAENAKQASQLIGVIIGLALLGILVLFILKGLREKKKANKVLVTKNVLIESQKESLEAQKEELEKKNHNIHESLDYAKKIQTSILPSIDGLANKFSDSFIFFKPKDIVSGDFYWYYEYDNKLYVSVSDCTGHGVPGAFMSIIGNNLIEKAIVEKRIEKPADVLKFMSDGINEKLGMTSGNSNVKDGMDMTLICIDKTTNKLWFSGARNSMYFLRNGNLEEIKATKLSVGYNSKKTASIFEHKEIDLIKGDRLYMFSDGFADQKGGPKGKKFYYKPFREILQGSGSESMKFQRDLLESIIVNWMDGKEQLDDILVLGIEI